MDIREQDIKGELKHQIEKNKPFSLIKSEALSDWINESKLIKFKPGEKVISYGQINEKIYIIIQGTVRLLMNDEDASDDEENVGMAMSEPTPECRRILNTWTSKCVFTDTMPK